MLPFYPIGSPQWAAGVGDITDPFWDPINRRNGAFVKMPSASDREFGAQSRTVRDGLGIRLTALTTSGDFVHWTRPRRVFVPDEQDQGVTEFYGAEVLSRGDILIALVRVLRDDLAADPDGSVEGVGYTAIATSRDGKSWQRHRDVFLDRCPVAGSFDHAFAWVYATLEWQDLVYLYYAAYDEGHKVGRRSIGLATQPARPLRRTRVKQLDRRTPRHAPAHPHMPTDRGALAERRRSGRRVARADTRRRPSSRRRTLLRRLQGDIERLSFAQN